MAGLEKIVGLAFVAMAVTPSVVRAQVTEVVLYSLPYFANGENPQAGVIVDAAGNLYGATAYGGLGNGVVYKLDATGHESVLHAFRGGSDGVNPFSVVSEDAAGNLYGTTLNGGTSGKGVVYKVDATAHETALYAFTGGTDGASPYAGVIPDSSGNLYGTTYYGGTANAGVVYRLDASGKETVLYNFSGGADGANPYAGVMMDPAGNLYGTTLGGGANGRGTVYKLSPAGQETVLHSFVANPDGGKPYAGVVMDAAGNLYGTTYSGGVDDGGTVYKIDAAGTETVLLSFERKTNPQGGVIMDASGNLYGTTVHGGKSGYGAAYELDPTGQETVLYSFGPSEGQRPLSTLAMDAAGNLYGTTVNGGGNNANEGVVFKIDTSGEEITLYTFFVGAGGAEPSSGVTLDAAGNVYGTTYDGGTYNDGVLYKLNPSGKETVMHAFRLSSTDGSNPAGNVAIDAAGNAYGATGLSGRYSTDCSNGCGVVYKVDPAGNETILHNFGATNADGARPQGVTLDSGNLYGTAWGNGTFGHGVLYMINSAGQETTLYEFTGGPDGGYPMAPVILDSAGNIYGTAIAGGILNEGVVFRVDPLGQETVLYSFAGGADGAGPYCGLVFDAAGNLYGTTRSGGPANEGTVFKLDTAGQETVLYSFTGAADGAQPFAGVILDSAGNLYGTTVWGGGGHCDFEGNAGCGTVYRLDAAGNLTVLYSFEGADDGGNPAGGVAMDLEGNIYGAAATGGEHGGGVVFEIKNAVTAP